MSTSTTLDKDDNGKDVDQKKYRGMIGSLLYLTASRLDIMLSVCLCARFQANPKESHSNFARSKIDRKDTSGTSQFLGNSLISWFSKKQTSIALSRTEIEYIAARSCCAQILWIKYQMEDYGIKFNHIPIRKNSYFKIKVHYYTVKCSCYTCVIKIQYFTIKGF